MSAQPSLCFVHGMACRPTDWDGLRTDLADSYSSIAPDLGLFEPDAGGVLSVTVDAMAARVAAACSGPTVLIGHSMGCRVVLQAALQRPEETSALVLLDGSCFAGVNPAVMLDPIQADKDAFLEGFFGQMIGPRMPAETGRGLIERAKEIELAPLVQAMADVFRWDEGESRAALHTLRATPILVLQSTTLGGDGKRRPLETGETNAWMETVADEGDAVTLVSLAGFGHFPMIDDPAAVAEPLRDFLASL